MDAPASAVFARAASRPIPRVLRMMGVADQLGYSTEFCGAFREEGLDYVAKRFDDESVTSTKGEELARVGTVFGEVLDRVPSGRPFFVYLDSTRPTGGG